MKVTIYELLGMIKDGNIPKRIIYDQFVYVWNSKIENYQREVDEITTLNWDYITINCLNEPVEILNKILEEKKLPEKLDDDEYEYNTANEILFMRKINEMIDYLKSKGE